jgi:hypothetical protein
MVCALAGGGDNSATSVRNPIVASGGVAMRLAMTWLSPFHRDFFPEASKPASGNPAKPQLAQLPSAEVGLSELDFGLQSNPTSLQRRDLIS